MLRNLGGAALRRRHTGVGSAHGVPSWPSINCTLRPFPSLPTACIPQQKILEYEFPFARPQRTAASTANPSHGAAVFGALVPPKPFEPIGCKRGLPGRILNVAVTQVSLERPGIDAVIRQLEAAGVAQHVGMRGADPLQRYSD